MQLKEYIKSEGLTQEGFARFIGVSMGAINTFCQKKKSPSLEVAHLIVVATKGKVTYQDLLSGKGGRVAHGTRRE